MTCLHHHCDHSFINNKAVKEKPAAASFIVTRAKGFIKLVKNGVVKLIGIKFPGKVNGEKGEEVLIKLE